MASSRSLVIVADDFGIGPETSRGILELGQEGRITAAVLLVNSPFAAQAVRKWKLNRRPMRLGWHANLTLDHPLLAPSDIPSLVGPNGQFWPLKEFLRRAVLGKLRLSEIEAEWNAQWHRYVELVGEPPAIVNSHHHVAVFPPMGDVLLQILRRQKPLPYVRRVREDWQSLLAPGSLWKRVVLSAFGTRLARRCESEGFPGCECLIGINNGRDPMRSSFFAERLASAGAESIELMCHPGYRDESLKGRDGNPSEIELACRESELRSLRRGDFLEGLADLGYEYPGPSGPHAPIRRAA
jgi:predicted glycoside hydrolase/deacetylase ChbG (UPF0249 family)